VVLSGSQSAVVDAVVSGEGCWYICGPPGCGKTRVLREIVSRMGSERSLCVDMEDGMWCSYYVFLKVLKSMECAPSHVFIDNVHKWDSNRVYCLDVMLREKCRMPFLPFGGVRIVCAGDAALVRKPERAFFRSVSWKCFNVVDVLYEVRGELRADIASAIISSRRNRWNMRVERRVPMDSRVDPLVLAKCKRAQELNEAGASRCDGGEDALEIRAQQWAFSAAYKERLEREMCRAGVQKVLRVKAGYVVLTTLQAEHGVERYTRCLVRRASKEQLDLERVSDGLLFSVKPVTMAFCGNDDRLASVRQFPVMHGWATHKLSVAVASGGEVALDESLEKPFGSVVALLRRGKLLNPPSEMEPHHRIVSLFIQKTERECIETEGGQVSGSETVVSHLQARDEAE
jgi:hypothetical protein